MSDEEIFPTRVFRIMSYWSKATKRRMGVLEIPWGMIAPHEMQAKWNHAGQDLEKLNGRGGLSDDEALAVLGDHSYAAMWPPNYPIDLDECRAKLMGMVSAWEAEHPAPAKKIDAARKVESTRFGDESGSGRRLGEGRARFPAGPFTVSPGVCAADVEILPGVPVPPASPEQFQQSFALHLQELGEAGKEWAKKYEAWKIERHAAVYLDLFCQDYTEEQRRDFIQRVLSKCLQGKDFEVVKLGGAVSKQDPFSAPVDTPPAYDMSIHSNPDARAWAKFYLETVVRMTAIPSNQTGLPLWLDEGTMIGWFANAMCAQHDYDARRAAAERGRLMALIESWRTDNKVNDLGEVSTIMSDVWELRQEHANQLAVALNLDEASREFPKSPDLENLRTKFEELVIEWRTDPDKGTIAEMALCYPEFWECRQRCAWEIAVILGLEIADGKPSPESTTSKFVSVAWLIGCIFFYGNFKAETHAERQLEAILRGLGYFFENEDDLIAKKPASLSEKVEEGIVPCSVPPSII